MGEKVVVGPVDRGLRTNREPFVIDNDSFPTLINSYQWRGRAKRKRGTTLLGRLQRSLTAVSIGAAGASPWTFNLFTLLGLHSSQPNAAIVPGTLVVNMPDVDTLHDNGDGTLSGSASGSGIVNYATGAITITYTGIVSSSVAINVTYYPELPVMGLEELVLNNSQFPGTLGFDTIYSYNIPTAFPYTPYDVSFYKNPAANPNTLPGYTPKSTQTALTWNGRDYQQFWSTNYQNAFWETNGIDTNPITLANIGMQFKAITGVSIITAGNGTTVPAVADLTIVAHGLVQGDFIFVNEVSGITGINFQTGYVTSANPQAANLVRVTFPFAILGGAYTSGGIAQYLTNRSDTTKDCLRWYDGDPTTVSSPLGWVNFMPPLSASNFSIANLPARQYYLVGSRMILPFKDRLLFFGPVVQASSGAPIYLQDTVIFSQNGTAYYTASFNGDPSLATTVFHPILVPINQTGTPIAYWEDQTGFGGFISAGVAQPILTVGPNQDALIVGFNGLQTKLIYSGNDVIPFSFYLTNAELGSGSTFSSIIMQEGIITRGNRGYIITDQTSAERIDLENPDLTFQISLGNNGSERMTAQRDYINEWIYFTYPSNQVNYVYPTQTFMYNYRDNSWSIVNECYTTYGQFKPSTGLTWNQAPVWDTWDDPWNSGSNTLLQPQVIAGNQQGFILIKEDETVNEATSLAIQSFSGNTVTSPNHCLNTGDFIIISNCIGSIGANVNGKIFQVINTNTNTFTISISPSGTYSGGGLITRTYVPYIQTRQFPISWAFSRKTRLGPQQYLLTKTPAGQMQLLIFLSQNASTPYNTGKIVPSIGSINKSLIYSTTLYTCPEGTNLGLTPANINLQMVTGEQQSQIWHRINTSLLGDTVQVGFTISDDQMIQFSATDIVFSITGATKAYPCVLTVNNNLTSGAIVQVSQVQGMTELNNDTNEPNPIYQVISATSTTLTLNVDSTSFTNYTSGGIVTVMQMPNQFAEIELHGFILDCSPSQVLA